MPTPKQALMTEPAPCEVPRPVGHSPGLPPVMPMFKAPKMVGVSRSTLYRAAAAGQIRLLKNGRSTLVDTASVLAWLAGMPAA